MRLMSRHGRVDRHGRDGPSKTPSEPVIARPAGNDAVEKRAPEGLLSRDMNENMLVTVSRLSDEVLLANLKRLAHGSRQTTVELIAHLAEVATRKLHRREGPGRLFGYCTQVLRFSEAAAFNRIKAAKAARRFPIVFDLLADGSVNLTTVRLLAPHLTEENHRALLAEASGMTRRQVDKLVARLSPRPDVASSIRKLPATREVVLAAEAASVNDRSAVTSEAAPSLRELAAGVKNSLPDRRPVVEPLSPERYRIQVTVAEEAHDDLRVLQDLLRRDIPNGDAAAIIARALKLLRQEVEKKAFAATSRPRPGSASSPGSRHIPAAVKRAVWERDGGQCAFVAATGRQCTERSDIEYHHANVPHAQGGEATAANIALRCRDHNVYESELIFGVYEPSRVRERAPGYGECGSRANWSRDQ